MSVSSEKLFSGGTALVPEPVPDDQIVAGSPTTGVRELGEFGGASFGVWEMSVGAMSDTEADEIFVVLSGAATIQFVSSGASMTIGPGDVVRLLAGDRTVWTVTETLRKLYLG